MFSFGKSQNVFMTEALFIFSSHFFWGGKLTKLKFMSLNNLPGMRLWNAALSSVSERLQDSVLAGHIKSRL